MVLLELGNKLCAALKKMRNSPTIDKKVLNELLKEFGDALTVADVPRKLVITLKVNVIKKVKSITISPGTNKRVLIEKTCISELTNLLQTNKKSFTPKRGDSNVLMFVGLQGSGKTTSATKLAYWYKQKGWSTAIVCADTFRAGAFDQVKQNATKVGIPFYGSYTENDSISVAVEGVERFRDANVEIIIVDTSGRHKQESALFLEMQSISKSIEPDEIIFVLDSTVGQSAFDQAEAFSKAVTVGSVILTKLDGHSKGGGAISAVSATKCPICFIGVGEHMDQFEQFNAHSFVSRLLGKWDVTGLMNLYNEAKVPIDEPEMMKRLMKGKFSIRDMRSQLQTLLNMGPGLIGMVPGLSKMMPKGSEKKSQETIKRFMTLMDSMTDYEMDGEGNIFNESRIRRICKGAGQETKILKDLLNALRPFKKMGGNLGKVANKAGVSDLNSLSPSQIASVMNPRALKEFGGKRGFLDLMKDMKNMDKDKLEDTLGQLSGKMQSIKRTNKVRRRK